MARIGIEELEAGMVLAGDLLGPTGRFLLSSGTILDEKHIRVLKMWGVSEADVEGVSEEEAEASQEGKLDPEAVRWSKENLENRFVLMDMQHEAVRELFRVCVLRSARRLTAMGLSRPPEGGVPECRALEFAEEETPTVRMRPEDILRKDIQLASLPDIFVQINEVLNNPRSSANQVGEIISKDQSLSAKLLKLVNSSFYGFPSRIDTLSRAVTVAGSKQLVTLALGISVITMFKNIPPELIDMRSFWKHSIACAMIAKVVAGYVNNPNEERFFVSGLLHDIGRLVIFKNLPELARFSLVCSVRESVLMHEAEREVMGFDHAKVGSLLMREWKFPPMLETMIRYHHQPHRAPSPLEPSVIHLADIICQAMDIGSSGNCHVPALDPVAWEALGLPKNVLAPIITQVDHQIDEVMSSFVADGETATA